MKVTLGRLARRLGMARSSLLHYESLGLLRPQGRSPAGYRLYGDSEVDRLRAIRRYRDAGLSLQDIVQLLKVQGAKTKGSRAATEPSALLEARLTALTEEIDRLRAQQRLVARLLACPAFRNVDRCRSKEAWTQMLRRAGFSDAEMRDWHASFEGESPDEHAQFLASLGLTKAQVASVRKWALAPTQ